VDTLASGETARLAHVGSGTDLEVRVLHHDVQQNMTTVADFGRSRLVVPDEDRPRRHRLTFEIRDRQQLADLMELVGRRGTVVQLSGRIAIDQIEVVDRVKDPVLRPDTRHLDRLTIEFLEWATTPAEQR